MIQRLLNAITTRLLPHLEPLVKQQLEASRGERNREVRELIGEMEDVLEKFSRVVAREAMRRTREMKAAMDEREQQPAQEAAVATGEIPQDLPPAERKRLLRQRLAAGGLRVPRGGE